MVTMVGTQEKFEDALYELCELDYDAVEAYEAAINRLDKKDYVSKMEEFKNDHQRHIEEISNLLRKHQAKVPDGPSPKNILTQGKVVLANLMGDEAILKAMLSNEQDTNTAYERLNEHKEKWGDANTILSRGLEDERRHKQWIQLTLNGYK
ncbi:ferritin-like domain-containing protein [Legionella gresilensis]|uniref:ferritin-like domain-containing protein n=1 Tax=Legionella gresilensis TaxID=91823 RepID=UPI001040FC9A|nr:ferritin-like domain-containing protein [Legionella gresilensis]